MGLWVLEPHSDEKVPGTIHIRRDTKRDMDLTRNLKHGTGRHSKTVLVPQPSDSPNDPLNWSQWRKNYTLIFLTIGTGIMSGTLNFVNPSNAAYAKYLGTNVSNLSQSISIELLCVGVSVIVSSPAARIWGKRPVLLVSNIIAIIGYAIVLSNIRSMSYLYAGRAIHGLGLAGLEYLVTSTIGDLFFVHERAFQIAVWHFGLQAGNSCGQVIGAQIVSAQSWYWAFTYAVIITSVYTVIFFFSCPETSYIRPSRLNTDVRETLYGENGSSQDTTLKSLDATTERKHIELNTVQQVPADIEEQPRTDNKTSYWSSLKVYNGRYSDDSLLLSIITPFSVYMLPAVIWGAYGFGCSIAFAASFSVSLSSIFGGAPYHFTTSQIGLTVLASFVGGSLGNIIPGPILDWLVKYMSRKNGGVYEPEFRNILLIPAFFLGLGGFWGFGLTLHYKCHWMAPVFFYGLATFAGAIVSLVSNAYLLDCHRLEAQEGYAAVTFGRSIFSFIMTFVINDWIARDGILNVFFVIGTLHGLACIFGLILYVYGKRIRLAIHKNAFIQRYLGTVKMA
ncbi:hypothetical protein SEUCBS140593_002026 [Sporothrix eucalyptigena]|uniref:Major facilitator superfamily (MFS) profile domain-containing protein n=1 Tax=Sporothrix eucalyptigena TaxID=1812306 RepID=A0ABP0B3A2_9PEZI